MIDKIDGLLFPHRYDPFSDVGDESAFERAWRDNRAWVLANLSHLAYHQPAKIEALTRSLGAREVWTYDRDGAQAFLAVWTDKSILAFCGTQAHKPIDWNNRFLAKLRRLVERYLDLELRDELLSVLANDVLADIKFKKVVEGTARVHRGFLGELDKLWRFETHTGVLEGIAKDLAGITQPAWVTGHSLGGAMAVLASMRHPFEETITFGEPRVGTDIAAMFKSGKHTRYVHGADPVADLPPIMPGWIPRVLPLNAMAKRFGYEHHGDEVQLKESGWNVLFDHSILLYVESLEKYSHP